LALALGALSDAQRTVKEAQAAVDALLSPRVKIVKRVKRTGGKKGKWSWYKRKKFSKKVKARWDNMSAEERAARIARLKAGRGL
jgi:hypothetical protein